jgi:hypothetical protein
MLLASVHPLSEGPSITFTVALDNAEVDVVMDPNRSVADLIQCALAGFLVQETPQACHLATPFQIYTPADPLSIVALDNGGIGGRLSLRLPQ